MLNLQDWHIEEHVIHTGNIACIPICYGFKFKRLMHSLNISPILVMLFVFQLASGVKSERLVQRENIQLTSIKFLVSQRFNAVNQLDCYRQRMWIACLLRL